MPRPLGLTGTEGLPLWDTVEAVYFLVAGFSAGVVIGFLFPSMWRAFRRRFRNIKRFASALPEQTVSSPLKAFEESGDEAERRKTLGDFSIEALFVHARSLVQGNRPRDAVQMYLDILGDERVSKGETNRALFELAQAYSIIGLSGRAFDVGIELLSRKPKHRQVFLFLLGIVSKSQRYVRVLELLPLWKGDADSQLRTRIAHAICEHSESLLRSGQIAAAKDAAALATRWSFVCARARLLLWQTTSEEMLEKVEGDVRRRWIALAADLDSWARIYSEVEFSPMATASHARKLMVALGKNPNSINAFPDIHAEFLVASGMGRAGEKNTRRAVESLVLATLVCEPQGWNSLSADAFLPVAALVVPTVIFRISSVSSSLSEGTIKGLQVGLKAHRCKVCSAMVGEFVWECPQCFELESFFPVATLNFEISENFEATV